MSEAELVKLLDVAMRSAAPEDHLVGIRSAFDEGSRRDDTTIAAFQLLYRAGEIEVLMCMRAEWLGQRASTQPRKASGL